jgi:peroxiredoxin Q/BCP
MISAPHNLVWMKVRLCFQDGKTVKLSSKVGGLFNSKPVVLFFYPKDNTPGCTLEAKAFSSAYSKIKSMGAEVYGISSDSVESHKDFCDTLGLQFTLLSDEGGKGE